MRKRIAAISAIALMAALLATTGPASASEDRPGDVAVNSEAVNTNPYDPLPEVPAPQVGDPINAAEMQDLQSISRDFGISLDEAIERYSWADNFSVAMGQLRSEGIGFTVGEAGERPWIGFKGDAPKSLDRLLGELGKVAPWVEIEIREGLGYDEQEMIAALEAAHFAIFDHPSVIDASSSFDHTSRSVQIEASPALRPRTVVSAADLDLLASMSLAQSSDAASLFRVEVVLAEDGLRSSSDDADHTDWHIGGEELKNPAGDLVCTSGFNCNEVRKNPVCSGNNCNLVQMEDHHSIGGDSGGPWFMGNIAYGYHRGSHLDPTWWPARKRRALYSKTPLIDDAISVFVATS